MAEGIVHLVGAGPGDPGLMTRRALELIAEADAILYDRLIPAGALRRARARTRSWSTSARRPATSRCRRRTSTPGWSSSARKGLRVVRLKGGDPFVFGRGGEEAEALREAGVPFEVVPGVTAGVAAPAYAGIPVTHRDLASAVAFVTGHEDPAKDESALDWDALAAFPGTLVLYMGVKNLPTDRRAADRRRAAGGPARGRDRARHAARPADGVRARSTTSPRAVGDAGLRAPAITVIGPAAGLRETLAWIERAAAARQGRGGHARAGAGERAGRAAGGAGRGGGGDAAIRIEPLPVERCRAIGALRAGLLDQPQRRRSLLFDALVGTGDARALAGVTVAAIGPGTARELAARGIRADVVPGTVGRRVAGEGAGGASRWTGKRVLVARAAEARDVLPDALRERGAEVDVLPLYETVAEPLDDGQREALGTRRPHHLHLVVHGALLHGRRERRRARRRAWCRSGR